MRAGSVDDESVFVVQPQGPLVFGFNRQFDLFKTGLFRKGDQPLHQGGADSLMPLILPDGDAKLSPVLHTAF